MFRRHLMKTLGTALSTEIVLRDKVDILLLSYHCYHDTFTVAAILLWRIRRDYQLIGKGKLLIR